MKTILLATMTMLMFSANLFAIEVIQGKPHKKYTVISPVSSSKGNAGLIGKVFGHPGGIEKAYKDLIKKAEKLGADALIEWTCSAGLTVKSSGSAYNYQGGGFTDMDANTKVPSVCQGLAVKWN